MRASAILRSVALAALASATWATWNGDARGDVQHVVARGHTIEAIAHRYHVTPQAIVDANHLKDPKHLRIGETLVIPGVQAAATGSATGAKGKKGPDGKPVKPVTYAMRPKTPDVIHVTRLATTEDYTLHVNARRGKVSPTVAKTAEQMMRSMGGLSHPIEPRLVHLLAAVSNHFGSRKIEIISGFRPYSPLQHTAHSNHNIGKAVDFRVVGVPNEVVRDYCRSLRDVGCGYYPNSTFVHMDVRDTSSFWIDYSRPGEPPRYNAPNLDADEGTSDVGEEAHLAPPSESDTPAVAPELPGAASPTGDSVARPSAVPSAAATPALPSPVSAPSPSAGTSAGVPVPHASASPAAPPPPPAPGPLSAPIEPTPTLPATPR
jgi:uncharacterized protein YcbK (DUF882 family)